MNRRKFLQKVASLLLSMGTFGGLFAPRATKATVRHNGAPTKYGMGIQVDNCIGCGKCMEACKTENDVPQEPFFFRTWVEKYVIKAKGEVNVQNIDGIARESVEPVRERDILRSFFVPKLCNQCEIPPCVQVCPVKATFQTEDGVILVDDCLRRGVPDTGASLWQH
jgi:Fe-S-cluster-containing dehydrogenase component